MEYDLGGFTQVIALEERRREALPELPPSDLINIALQKYRYQRTVLFEKPLFGRALHLQCAVGRASMCLIQHHHACSCKVMSASGYAILQSKNPDHMANMLYTLWTRLDRATSQMCYLLVSRYLDLWPCGSDDRLHLERLLGWKPPAMPPPAAAPPPAAIPSPAAPPLQPPPKRLPAQVRDGCSRLAACTCSLRWG